VFNGLLDPVVDARILPQPLVVLDQTPQATARFFAKSRKLRSSAAHLEVAAIQGATCVDRRSWAIDVDFWAIQNVSPGMGVSKAVRPKVPQLVVGITWHRLRGSVDQETEGLIEQHHLGSAPGPGIATAGCMPRRAGEESGWLNLRPPLSGIGGAFLDVTLFRLQATEARCRQASARIEACTSGNMPDFRPLSRHGRSSMWNGAAVGCSRQRSSDHGDFRPELPTSATNSRS